MAEILRLKVDFAGGAVVGPSSSSFYTLGAEPAALRAAVNTFYGAFVSNLPSSLSVSIPPSGDVIDAETGEIVDIWTDGATLSRVGIDDSAHPAGVGCRVVWSTDGRTNRRRVRGTTFVVPLGGTAYESNGTLNQTFLDRIRPAAVDLVDDLLGTFVVWTRPKDGAGGKTSLVIGSSVPDTVSWLRSRRT